MLLLRLLVVSFVALSVVTVTSCQQTPDAELAAREELAQRNISIDIAGLKSATRTRDLDGAYLFEDVGYFATISDADFKEAIKHAASTENYGLYVMLKRYIKDIQYPVDELASGLNQTARIGSARIAELLIRNGAKSGESTLFHASYSNNYDLIDLLLKNGASLATGRNREALRIAARLGHLNVIKAFVDSGEAPGELIDQAILYAALTEKIEVVKYLVNSGVDINQEGGDGCSPLHYLAQDGSVDMIRYMVESGAEINNTCRGNETPLKWADYGDNRKVIGFLVRAGAVRK